MKLHKSSFLFPFLAVPVAMLAGADASLWWAYLIVAAIADAGLYGLFKLTSRSKQFLSGYVTSVKWEYAWTEKIVTTETKYDEVKKASYIVKRTEYRKHPDVYYWVLNTGAYQKISSRTYWDLADQWGTERYHIHVYHPDCVSGGDGERCDWDGFEEMATTVTYKGGYYNPVRHSHSIFSPRHISKKKAKELGLVARPKLETDHNVVLCAPKAKAPADWYEANRAMQLLNAFCGMRHEIHAYILLFPHTHKMEITGSQRDFWDGLHKNEFVVCLGVQKQKVAWCTTLSWSDDIKLDTKVREYFRKHPDITQLEPFVHWLRNNLNLWKRKEFKDFEYLGRNLSTLDTIWYWGAALLLAALTFGLCLGIGEV